VITRESSERLASRMLAYTGVQAIRDMHVAASAAYGLGRTDVAASLIEIAEAAEREWLSREAAVSKERTAARPGRQGRP
jgi:hypothetical protein